MSPPTPTIAIPYKKAFFAITLTSTSSYVIVAYTRGTAYNGTNQMPHAGSTSMPNIRKMGNEPMTYPMIIVTVQYRMRFCSMGFFSVGYPEISSKRV